jgi:hypothetical protein
MNSAFNSSSRRVTATSTPTIDETYDLRGLNLTLPDQVMPTGESPYVINSRMYAREEGESRVAIRTRRGSTRLTSAIGETLDAKNISANNGDLDFSTIRVVAQPFNPLTNGALTRIDFEVKRGPDAVGHVMIQLCADNGGIPGQVIGESSILASDITDAYQYISSYFIDAPDVFSAQQYWAVLFIQDNGSGSYYLRQTPDAGALDLQSADYGMSWSSLGVSFHFKSYLSSSNGIKGFHRRYPSNGNNRTLFAAGSSMYSAQDNGTVTEIDTHINPGAQAVRFDYVDDKSIWVDGISAPYWWNGTDAPSIVPNAPVGSSLVKIHSGRAFFLTDKTLWRFSELYDFGTYPSVNFFYVPDPKSSDPVTGARTFQDNFLIFTHKTKHIVYGNDISTFTRKEAIGTAGAVSDEAIAVSRNFCYFMDPEGNVWAFNGIDDGKQPISVKMEPEFRAIPDKSKVRFHLYNNQLRIYYQSATSSYNDRMALYDIQYDQWFKDTGRPVVGSLAWDQNSNNDLIEFSALSPWLFRGEQNRYSDVGKPLDWKYWTAYKKYGSGASKKRVKSFRPIIRTVDANYTMLVGKDMDFMNTPDMREYIVSGGGAKWGSFVWGDGTKYGRQRMVDRASGMSGRGKHLQYRFERKGVETPVELYGYISQVKEGRPR